MRHRHRRCRRKTVALVGSPNVGKSQLFNKLTGSYVTVSNYPGTTVAVDKGTCVIGRDYYTIIDTPGMYSFSNISEEERVTKLLLLEHNPDLVINIVDAKNLERMLPLTLQLIQGNTPVILVVNMMDEARKLGLKIDAGVLEKSLGIPVVLMTATVGEGLSELQRTIVSCRSCRRHAHFKSPRLVHFDKNIEAAIHQIGNDLPSRLEAVLALMHDADVQAGGAHINNVIDELSEEYTQPMSYVVNLQLQAMSKKIVEKAVKQQTANTGNVKKILNKLTLNPITGIPLLILVLYFGLYQFVGVFGAGYLVDLIETFFTEKFVVWFTGLVSFLPDVLLNLIVGEYGIVSMGINYAIAIIMPIVGTFFIAFSIIEDSGYLPRIAMLLDSMFKRIGLSGRAIIPMVLGLGCGTMATMVTRTQETKRERLIATILLALAIPCSAQLGVILAVLSSNTRALQLWLFVIIAVFVIVGYLASKILPGEKPVFYMELPPMRLPKFTNVIIKTYSRMLWYFKEVLPLFVLISVLVWVLELIGFFPVLIRMLEPLVAFVGLPKEAAIIFFFGFFRRDYGAAGLYDLQDTLSPLQLTVAAITLTLFVPCIAQFMMMIKERGLKTAILILGLVIVISFGTGFIINNIGGVLF